MKAIVNTAPNRLELQELPLPEPGAGQVRVRTGACAICASDLQMIAGWERTGFPSIPGHEWAGTIDALGPGTDPSLAGRRCVAENVLKDGGEVGFEHPGGYGEYLLTEARNVHLLPGGFPLHVAALCEPLAVAVHARDRLRLDAADPVLIFGDGAIGLLTLAVLAQAGHRRIVFVGGHEARLDLARSLGAGQTVNYHRLEGDLAAALRREIGADFATIVQATPSPAAMEAAVQLAMRGGRILILGDCATARASFAWNEARVRELELIGSNASAGAWPEAVRLAVEGSIPLARLVGRTLPASRFTEALALARRRGEHVRVVMIWQ